MFYYKQSYSTNMKIFIFSIVRREDEILVNTNTSHLTLAGRWHTAGESSTQSGILHCVLQTRKFGKKTRAQWRMTKKWDWMKRKISVSERIEITPRFKTKLNMVKKNQSINVKHGKSNRKQGKLTFFQDNPPWNIQVWLSNFASMFMSEIGLYFSLLVESLCGLGIRVIVASIKKSLAMSLFFYFVEH